MRQTCCPVCCVLCAVWQLTLHLRHTLLLLFPDRLTEPFINRSRELKIVLQRFMAWTLAYIQGYAAPHRLSCKHKHSHKCLQKMLLRWVHHLLFFCTICLVLVSTPIYHKKPRRHCKLFKANMHSAAYVTGNPQTLPEYRIFLTFLKPLLYCIKKATVCHHILKKNTKGSKWTRLFIMLTLFNIFSPSALIPKFHWWFALAFRDQFREFSLGTFHGAGCELLHEEARVFLIVI